MKLFLLFGLALLLLTNCQNAEKKSPMTMKESIEIISEASGAKMKSKPGNQGKYDRTRRLIQDNKDGIFKIIDRSRSESNEKVKEFVNLCLEQKNYKDFLTIGKQTESQSLEFFRLVDHFMERVNEAKRFKPNDSQKKLYEDVKGLIYKDMKVISLYIAYKNDKYNRTDLQRVKTYQLIMINDLEGYMAESMITEKEFDKSFNFLLSNWEKLTNELRREFN